ncbi:hypothetical protein EV128_1111, partial [Rhizobium azibense]
MENGGVRRSQEFHKIDYVMFVCSGILEMRHIGQLEMRQSSPLGMLVERQRWEA